MYPLLGIKRGGSVTPIETYIAWEGICKPHDAKLICKYHLRNDPEFLQFEKNKLYGNKLFCDFKQLDDNTGAYIFDFTLYKQDWLKIIDSNYSELSYQYKKQIETFYGRRDPNYAYVESFLYPLKYYGIYAELLDVDIGILQKTKQLCSKINLEKETLKAKVKNLEVITKNL
jgi:hypothetical protein